MLVLPSDRGNLSFLVCKMRMKIITPHLWELFREKDSNRYFAHPVFIALFTVAKKWKPPQVSVDRGMDRQNVVITYNGVLLAIEREF